MNKLKELRQRAGLKQTDIAHTLSVSQQAVAKWESGESMPQADKLSKLAKILNCTIDDLLSTE